MARDSRPTPQPVPKRRSVMRAETLGFWPKREKKRPRASLRDGFSDWFARFRGHGSPRRRQREADLMAKGSPPTPRQNQDRV